MNDDAQVEPIEVFLDSSSFSKGKKLYSCDVLTGKVQRVIPKKSKHKNPKTGSLENKFSVMSTDNLFFLTATSLENAKDNFEEQFKEMDETLREQGHFEESKNN